MKNFQPPLALYCRPQKHTNTRNSQFASRIRNCILMSSISRPTSSSRHRSSKMEPQDDVLLDDMDISEQTSSPLDESSSIPSSACCPKDYDLQTYYHLPDYLKHNPFIIAGYRSNLSFWQTTFSMFHWHNESLNIWSHFAGFVLFIILAIVSYTTWLNRAAVGEILSSAAFFVSVCAMMLFSTVFHLYNCCSSKTYDLTAKLDYTGITVLIVGSYYPLLYYLYYCPNHYIWRYGYGSIITILGMLALYSVWGGKMHKAGSEVFRLTIFLGMGLFGVIPLPHAIYLFGFKATWPTLSKCGIMGLCYVVGALIYGKKWPESFFPGKFDSVFSSHNIWHCFVLGGAISHYFAVVSAQYVRQHLIGTACG